MGRSDQLLEIVTCKQRHVSGRDSNRERVMCLGNSVIRGPWPVSEGGRLISKEEGKNLDNVPSPVNLDQGCQGFNVWLPWMCSRGRRSSFPIHV